MGAYTQAAKGAKTLWESLAERLSKLAKEDPEMFQLGRDLRSSESIPELTELGSGQGSIGTTNRGYMLRQLHKNKEDWLSDNYNAADLRERYGFLPEGAPISVIDSLGARGGAVPAYMRAYMDIIDKGGYNVSEGLTPINAIRRTPTMLSFGLREPEAVQRIIAERSQGIDPEKLYLSGPMERLGKLMQRDYENIQEHAGPQIEAAAMYPGDVKMIADRYRTRLGTTPQNIFDPRSAIGEASLKRGALYDYLLRNEEPPRELTRGSFYARGGSV